MESRFQDTSVNEAFIDIHVLFASLFLLAISFLLKSVGFVWFCISSLGIHV